MDKCTDDNGAYLNSRSTKKNFHVQIDTNANIISSNIVHKEDGHFYYNKRIGSNDYERVKITEENIYVLERYYRQCKSVPGLKRMAVRIKKMSSQM